jgi:hypothetical protein
LLPESVARENDVVAIDASSSGLVMLSDITSWKTNETIEKLRFVLNTTINYLHAGSDAIRRAIDRDYGPPDTHP